MTLLKENERVDYLIDQKIRVIQNTQGFCFSLDAVLLANFVQVKKDAVVCDLGTGTGAIPLILADRTKAANIEGLEIQEPMVDMARRSVLLNNLQDRIQIQQGDLKDAHSIYGSSRFDVVTANPPYMSGSFERKSITPEIAIAKHEILCTLQDVLLSASRIVKSRGRFAMVHRPQRLTDIVCQMRAVHLEPKRIRFVHPKKGTPANMVLIEAVKDGRMDVAVLDPLFVYEDSSTYTQDLLDIYAAKDER